MTVTHVRRVATGIDGDGKAAVSIDGEPERVVLLEHSPGKEYLLLWSTDAVSEVPNTGADPTVSVDSFVPPPGGSRFFITRWPGRSEAPSANVEPGASMSEQSGLAGIGELVGSSSHPPRHMTPSVDYGVVLRGEIWLELDDGRVVHLEAGDCVIQNGTVHAWHNRSAAECVMAFVMIGATAESAVQ